MLFEKAWSRHSRSKTDRAAVTSKKKLTLVYINIYNFSFSYNMGSSPRLKRSGTF